MLTRQQHALLLFINGQIVDSGVCPSFAEMAQAIGVVSKSGIHRLLDALELRGFVQRIPYVARGVKVLRLPASAARPNLMAALEAIAACPATDGARMREIARMTLAAIERPAPQQRAA